MKSLPALARQLRGILLGCCFLLLFTALQLPEITSPAAAETYEVVILNGRVMDPESNLNAVRNLGVTNGTIHAITTDALQGQTTIDAKGLIVSPGFIDLHQHGQSPTNHRFQVMDGVTTSLELELGTADVDRWYAERDGTTLINYGVSVGHTPARKIVMRDPSHSVHPTGDGAYRAATETELAEIKQHVERGLRRGAVAVGSVVQNLPAASRWEVLELFRIAAQFHASFHLHIRHQGELEPANSFQALEEGIAAAAITGAPLHVVHLASSGLRATPRLLQMIAETRSRGLDVTTECYPYAAGATSIEAAVFDEGWQQRTGIDYHDVQWAATGERLTAESFARYRKTGGRVIVHVIPEEIVQMAVAHPLTMIASDGLPEIDKGHPRSVGTHARVLGRYVREAKALTLMDALRKMTLMPAQRLEQRAPMMKNKGRIRTGADADLTVFDLERVIDTATYEEPAKYSEGIKYVLVNGVLVVKEGQLQHGLVPGRPVRAPIQ